MTRHLLPRCLFAITAAIDRAGVSRLCLDMAGGQVGSVHAYGHQHGFPHIADPLLGDLAAGMEPTAGAWGVAGAWYVAFKDDPRSSGTRLEQPIGSGTRIVGAGT